MGDMYTYAPISLFRRHYKLRLVCTVSSYMSKYVICSTYAVMIIIITISIKSIFAVTGLGGYRPACNLKE